ncbi:MAG TPA: T6SS immunity protein Tdi1 domain-containing protein [Mucilaginibacter sp.]|jgi:hypothetical protein|nr:T6SS immunity protein Tdi1 domain-containing protein [Mucilaginibacter sp.]
MDARIKDFIIDISEVDLDGIFDAWKWRLNEMCKIILISKMGDVFLLGNDEAIYWLGIDIGGVLKKIANNIQDFNSRLDIYDNIDNWFLPGLVEQIVCAGIHLNGNQVYSFKKLPVLGGDYSLNNIEPTDISIHFYLTGQICEQIKDLPNRTKVKIVIGD